MTDEELADRIRRAAIDLELAAEAARRAGLTVEFFGEPSPLDIPIRVFRP